MGNRCSIQQSEESNCWLEQSPENRVYRLFRSFWATLYCLWPLVAAKKRSFPRNRSWLLHRYVHASLEDANAQKDVCCLLFTNRSWSATQQIQLILISGGNLVQTLILLEESRAIDSFWQWQFLRWSAVLEPFFMVPSTGCYGAYWCSKIYLQPF